MGVAIHYARHAMPAVTALGELRASVGWARAESELAAALPRYALTVAAYTSDNLLVGWASLLSDGVRHAFFVDVIVHAQYQGQGIGKTLVQQAIGAMQAEGITLFHVDFAPKQAAFYQACGFTLGGGGYIDLQQSSLS